ncbi:MAG: sulfatase-like hydrolase/transferase, partial [Gammaproteobacteria bacterium]|nr:sulfatase-like hydrolase/transferase [Gammaproteobacteria bacterium]
MNLTAEGTADWIHWGRTSTSSPDRKAGVTAQISDFAAAGGANPSVTTQTASGYTWTDGAPATSISNSRTGLWVFGVGKGFQFTVPADDSHLRTLKVYLGATAAQGQLTATLSDASAPPYSLTINQVSGRSSRIVTLDFQAASPDQTLTVSYIVTTLYQPNFQSWITLESAALQVTPLNQAPTVNPIGNQTVTEGLSFSLPISATDSDGPAPLTLSQTNTLPGNPNILTDNGNGSGTLNWTPPVGSAAGGPYSVTVTATDGVGAFSSLTFSVTVQPAAPPNIVVILTDDQGYGDVAYANLATDLETPNLDDLAAHGMRFNNFYANSSVCSPTRAALMTGRYPALVGVTGTVARDPVTNMGYFSPTGPTLPELLKSAGYTTGLIGKWHLGDHLGEDPHNLPTRRGFDHFHGFIGAAGDYYTHDGSNYGWPGDNLLMLNDTVLDPASLQGIHTTDLITQWAKDYIQERAGSSQPFMMYLAFSAPHDPVQPLQVYLDQVLAREPGIDPERAKLVALIEHLDNSIGQVVQELKDNGVYDNTLIIYTSDNGGYLLHDANNGPYRGGKLDFYEGGIRVPMAAVWPGRIEPGTQSAEIALTMDLYSTIAEAAGATIEHSIEGRSILPTLLGQNPQYLARDLFFENRSTFTDTLWKTHYAVRRQDWKLVQNAPGGTFELYDLASDPYEAQNLAASNPAKVAELTAALDGYKAQEDLVPWQPPL